MRASRLLSILMLLQTRGRLSAPVLAAELEVSVRTILRDIDELSASGVPVWADRGREGGFQLAAGWSTQLTGITEPESQALFLAGVPSAASELGLGSASASARLKMLSALPASLRDNALRVSARLHFDPSDWFRATTPPPHLQAVADAVWHQRRVAVRYESWRAIKEHLLKPLGLVLKAGVWYVVAVSDQRRATRSAKDKAEPRIYRLSNILAIEVQSQTFARPKRFDLASFWRSAAQRFETNIYTGSADVRVTPQGMKLLKEISPAIAESATGNARPDATRSGWTLTRIPTESTAHATTQLLGLGIEIEVLAPAELRARIAQTLRSLNHMYGLS